MNYLIINDKEYFQDRICFENIKEVINDNDRCDVLFGTITTELLERTTEDSRRRDKFYEDAGIYGFGGIEAMVFKIPQGILYDRKKEFIETCFRFIDENSFYTQIWSYSQENQAWEYFLIGINKKNKPQYLINTNTTAKDDYYGIKRICELIKNILC